MTRYASPAALVPRPHTRLAFRTGLRGLSALALGAVLAGCPAPTSVVRPAADTSTAAQRADRLARSGDAAGSARAWEEAATRSQGAARTNALTAATRQWLAAQNGAEASRVYAKLAGEAPVEPRTPAGIERALLGADVALAAGQPDRALAAIRALGEPPPPGTEPAVLLVRGRAQLAAGRALDGVRTFADRERLVPAAEAASNRQALWEALRAAAARGADLRVPKGTDALAAGWLELARIATQGGRNPFALRPQVEQWRTRYATHPANGPLVNSMLAEANQRLGLPPQVALVLPLTGRMEAAGTALRDGFLAAWYQQDAAARPEVRVYDSSPDAVAAYRRAVADGAAFVVGPLAKEDVQAVAQAASPDVSTLALNVLPDGVPPPQRFYQFALAPEDESRQVAERLVAEGRRVGVALVPSGEWGARVLAAFEAGMRAGGGNVVASRFFPNGMTDFSELITGVLGFDDSRRRHRQLVAALGTTLEFAPRRRDDLQYVFVAGQPVQGRLIRPQLKFHYAGDLPVYAISDVFDPNPAANEDLEGVTFADTPWMIAQDPAVASVRDSLMQLWPQNVRRRGRLYAMGFDAYRLVAELKEPGVALSEPIAGMTGRLTVDADGRVRRGLEWATIGADGQPRALPALIAPL